MLEKRAERVRIALACFREQPAHAVLLWAESHSAATLRGPGSRQEVGETFTFVRKRLSRHHCIPTSFPLYFPVGPSWQGPALEAKSVFLCGEVRVLLVPFAWGQALFVVEVLRVYPNVQDLGVSARLSESGGGGDKRRTYGHEGDSDPQRMRKYRIPLMSLS